MAITVLAWRGISVFLLLTVLVQFYLIFGYERRATPALTSIQPATVIQDPPQAGPNEWAFDSERDANNPALTSAQCDAAFPDLYYEIDRSVKYWKDRKHNFTAADIDIDWRGDGAMRVLIHDNQLRITHQKFALTGAYDVRAWPVLHLLQRAVLGAAAAGEKLPTVEFPVVVDDMALLPGGEDDTRTAWTWTRNFHNKVSERLWIMPDFNFWATGSSSSFYEMQWRAREFDAPFTSKIPKAVWRGVIWTNQYIRGNLMEKAAGKDWADVKETEWVNKTDFMNMEDQCRYAFVIHTEGRSWSGRLKSLLDCNSVTIVHDLDWQAYLYHLLIPEGPHQNYVPVKRDFSDLEKKVKHLMRNSDEAQRIADNAVATFRDRYLTMAAQTCYWRRMVQRWSEVAETPEIHETVEVEVSGEMKQERRLRGAPYEQVSVWMKDSEVIEWSIAQREKEFPPEKEEAGG